MPLPSLSRDAGSGSAVDNFRAGAAALTDLAQEFTLISHGLLLRHSGLWFDPVQQFINETPDECCVAVLDAGFPLFQGISPFWDSRLLLVEKGMARALLRHLGTVTTVKRRPGLYCSSFLQHLEIVDALKMVRMSHLPKRLPLVPLVAVGVDCRYGSIGIDPRGLPLVRKVLYQPVPDHAVAFAEALLAGDEDPYRAADPFYAKEKP